MRTRSALVLGTLAIAAAAALQGCYVDHYYHDHFYDYGTATLGWTIGGRADPMECTRHGAAYVHVVLRHDDDGIEADDLVVCTRLAIAYALHPGVYTAQLTMVDANHAPVSPTEDPGSLYVYAGVDTFVSVNFTPVQTSPEGAHPVATSSLPARR